MGACPCDEDGRRPGVSRMSLCSSAHRLSGIRSVEGNAMRRRLVIVVVWAVVEFGWEGMK